MQPFTLTLSNGGALTGLYNPSKPASPGYTAIQDSRRPLLVAIHGGSYSSSYFDANAGHTASLCSNSLGVPVVAIDRPLYQGSTTFFPVPDGKTYHEELAVWLHKYILPAVWKEFGRGCSSVVLHCHSLAVPSAVIIAGWMAGELARGEAPEYPLAGLTISGFGSQAHPDVLAHSSLLPPGPIPVFAPPIRDKDDMMLPAGTADPAVYELSQKLDNPMPWAERAEAWGLWFPDGWLKLCGLVRLPVLIGMAEHDKLWLGSQQHVKDFANGFISSERVDFSLVKEAPHCLELSYWAQGWYSRCFGWALECAAAFAARQAGSTERTDK